MSYWGLLLRPDGQGRGQIPPWLGLWGEKQGQEPTTVIGPCTCQESDVTIERRHFEALCRRWEGNAECRERVAGICSHGRTRAYGCPRLMSLICKMGNRRSSPEGVVTGSV